MTRTIAIAFLVSLVSYTTFEDDPKPATKVIPAAEAKDHLDKAGLFEMTVELSKNADQRKEYYLDSENDFHDPKNLAVVISYDDIEAFKKAGIDDPSKHYLNKKIHVQGIPRKEAQQIRIRISDPKHITIIEAKKP
jgi:hypothetical protein